LLTNIALLVHSTSAKGPSWSWSRKV